MSNSAELASILVGMNFAPIANFFSSLRFNDTGRTENCVWVSTARYLRFQTVSQLESAIGITAPPGGATYNQILGFLNAICEANEVRFNIAYEALLDSPGECMVGYGRADGSHHCVLREADGRFMDYQCSDDGIDVSGELSMPGSEIKLSWNLVPYDPSVEMQLGGDPSESESEGAQALSKRQMDSDDSDQEDESADEKLEDDSEDEKLEDDSDQEESEEEEGRGDEPDYLGFKQADNQSSEEEESDDDEANYRSDQSDFEVPTRHEPKAEVSKEEGSEEEESEEEESEEEEGRGDEPEYLGFKRPDDNSSEEEESDDDEANYRSDQSEFEVPVRY